MFALSDLSGLQGVLMGGHAYQAVLDLLQDCIKACEYDSKEVFQTHYVRLLSVLVCGFYTHMRAA